MMSFSMMNIIGNVAYLHRLRPIEWFEIANITCTFCRVEVANHVACWRRRFLFSCRIGSDVNSGILASCLCRISVRKVQYLFIIIKWSCFQELKGGKAYQKLGFVDINLAEFAASGVEGLTRSYLLDGYDSGHQRQDNSRITVKVTMVHQSADPFFKV